MTAHGRPSRSARRTPPGRPAPGDHVVGFSSDTAEPHPERRGQRRDRVGRWAVKGAVIGAALAAPIGAIAAAVLVMVGGWSDWVLVSSVIGGGLVAGALGGIWGAFAAVPATSDWREGLADTPAPHTPVPGDVDHDAADELMARGAMELRAVRETPTPLDADDPPAPLFSAPTSTAHESMGLGRFLGTVPVVLVFVPTTRADDTLLQELDTVHRRLGSEVTQLLVVATGPGASVLMERRGEAGHGGAPLLADDDGSILVEYDAGLRDRGETGDGILAVIIGLDGNVHAHGWLPVVEGLADEVVRLVQQQRASHPSVMVATDHLDTGGT